MEYRRLGRTDLNVSLICLGTMTWGQQNTEADGHAQMDYALDQGINFIDTAETVFDPAAARRRKGRPSASSARGSRRAATATRSSWPRR